MPQGECNELHRRLRHWIGCVLSDGFPLAEVRSGHAIDPPRPCGAAGRGAAKRVLVADLCEPEKEIIPTLEELGIGLVPYSPLGEGFPHRQDRREHDLRRVPTRATGYRASLRKRARQNQALVELLRSVGGRRGVTPAQTRSPGRSPGSRGSCRCLARGSSTASMRIWGRPPSRSPPAISTKSIALRRRSRFGRRLSRRDLEAVRSLGRSPVRQGAHSGFSSPRSASRWRRVKNGSSRARPSAAYSAVSARRFRGGTAQRASIRKFQQEY